LHSQPFRNGSGERRQCNVSVRELIRVGYVSGAHGLLGALRVRLDNPDSALLQRLPRVTLVRDGVSTEYQVIGAQPSGRGAFRVCLEGVSGVDDAAVLRGAIVMVTVAALPPTTASEFYYFQAIGCQIVTTTGRPLGIIEEVFSNGANDVWVVRRGSAEHLVPVIEDIVKGMDLAAGRVVIEAVPGLLA
jgi:16S rRNA processing protein RimM